ncbi:MAG: metallophosphoesterase [Granulosicoccus sp.]
MLAPLIIRLNWRLSTDKRARRHNCANMPMLASGLILLIACLVAPLAYASTKVAFIADQGISSSSRAVLSLIAGENTDIVVIQGDLGYEPDTALQWDQNLTNALGRNFPVISAVGNHEDFEWPLYQRLIRERMNRASGLSCTGDIGVKASCTFGNLQVVQVAQGIQNVPGVKPNDNYDEYIRSSFNNSVSRWKVCSWHKNQQAMQVYSKPDETGWDVYDACLDSGAMVVSGHAHTYSRTYLMKDFRSQEVAHRSNEMTLEPGRSFAVVSGLGGRDIRPQENSGDWFASVYTQSQGATHGALFCDLEESSAQCYFKSVNGAVPDQFYINVGAAVTGSDSGQTIASNSPSTPVNALITGGVFKRTDKNEFRWIAQDASGEWASSWISEACATELGPPKYTGNWNDLISIAPIVSTAPAPCTGNAVASGASPQSTIGGFVFSRTDKTEYRWIDTNSVGQLGSVWIDRECASRLGGVSASGDWNELIATAPGFDTLANPCTSTIALGGSRTPAAPTSDGYVFSRTDKSEYRWVEPAAFGTGGNIWINEECAQLMGGARASGDWFDLNRIAPAFDSVEAPCL